MKNPIVFVDLSTGIGRLVNISRFGLWKPVFLHFIVSASRSPPGQVPKKLEFGSCFSQSGGSLGSFLVDFSIIGGPLGALGDNF